MKKSNNKKTAWNGDFYVFMDVVYTSFLVKAPVPKFCHLTATCWQFLLWVDSTLHASQYTKLYKNSVQYCVKPFDFAWIMSVIIIFVIDVGSYLI